MKLLASIAIALVVVLAACDSGQPAATAPTVTTTTAIPTTTPTTVAATTTTTTTRAIEVADIVFTNGSIVTMDSDIGTVDAMAVKSDHVLDVGTATTDIDERKNHICQRNRG